MTPDDFEKKELLYEDENPDITEIHEHDSVKRTLLSGMYQNWFLDYASYVILERAVPNMNDGLKPVHRRILYAMKKLDDGRYNKVANIIGYTMQYHPHGDASIGDALVQLGQKDLLIDTQGNWGNIFTGDNAAASRYIEARLSKFAIDVVFNPKTTQWKLSYDGRNKEPITLPVKFPLLLTQGVEGIAVGLASKILPHNFNELIDASIDYLNGNQFNILPDFPTGGLADFSRYNEGLRGGTVKIRTRISKFDKKTLIITELPFGKTTLAVIDSIIKANDKGKIKIKKVDDNTAEKVEILVHLPNGVSPDKTIDALYAFTDCEVSVSPNSCVIDNNIPKFVSVNEILKTSADLTVELLKKELEIRKSELENDWHLSSLEKIFIENRIYNHIEECETWKEVTDAIDKGLEPFKKLLKREVTYDDIVNLTEIKIKKISKYDLKKADEHIKGIESEIEEVKNHIENIISYSINYFKQIKKKHGKGRERKTEIRNFDTIVATKVVEANQKLFVNKKEGFIGTGLKKDEYVCDCSDIDDIIVFRKNGKYTINKVTDKIFVGKDIIHVDVFKKNDERTIYNTIYRNGKRGNIMMKRFFVKGVTRDKEYDITQGDEMSKVLYFSCNPNGEAETIKIFLKPKPKLKKPILKLDFSKLAVKGRGSIGNILTRHETQKIVLKEKGVSTLGDRKIWFDDAVLRLNTEERGKYLGEYTGNDKILVVYKSGYFKLYSFDISNHFDDDILIIEKYQEGKIISTVYFDVEQGYYYIKRFQIEETNKESYFIEKDNGSKLINLSDDKYPKIELKFGGKHQKRDNEIIDVDEFIGIKNYKAKGKRLTTYEINKIIPIETVITETETIHDDDIIENLTNDEELPTETSEKETLETETIHDEDIIENLTSDKELPTETSEKETLETETIHDEDMIENLINDEELSTETSEKETLIKKEKKQHKDTLSVNKEEPKPDKSNGLHNEEKIDIPEKNKKPNTSSQEEKKADNGDYKQMSLDI
ncbi:MAG: DNA gyrase/topoisomerase IV subunit A [Bacteroidales bacterium]|nr:DNA gyrase/topoisomerase IV subunit A [Bacteroidales bacterium]